MKHCGFHIAAGFIAGASLVAGLQAPAASAQGAGGSIAGAASARTDPAHPGMKSGTGGASASKQGPAGGGGASVGRDPFRPLVVARNGFAGSEPGTLPPGKAGLMVNAAQVQGTLQTEDGMIAVVANGPHVYFLHPGDRLFDGSVKQIRMGEVIFNQQTRDAFGHPVDKVVVKRVGGSMTASLESP